VRKDKGSNRSAGSVVERSPREREIVGSITESVIKDVIKTVAFASLLKDARSVFLYPYNQSQIFQNVKNI